MYTPKQDKDFRCPLEYAYDILSGRWKSRLMCLIDGEPRAFRYTELREGMINISDAALSKALRELIDDDMIARVQYDEIPPRVEYYLTEKGKSFMPILKEMCAWGRTYYSFNSKNQMIQCLNCEHNTES